MFIVIQTYLTRRGGRLYVFYIDYLKAFDNCAHPKIWECLARKGINPYVLEGVQIHVRPIEIMC